MLLRADRRLVHEVGRVVPGDAPETDVIALPGRIALHEDDAASIHGEVADRRGHAQRARRPQGVAHGREGNELQQRGPAGPLVEVVLEDDSRRLDLGIVPTSLDAHERVLPVSQADGIHAVRRRQHRNPTGEVDGARPGGQRPGVQCCAGPRVEDGEPIRTVSSRASILEDDAEASVPGSSPCVHGRCACRASASRRLAVQRVPHDLPLATVRPDVDRHPRAVHRVAVDASLNCQLESPP